MHADPKGSRAGQSHVPSLLKADASRRGSFRSQASCPSAEEGSDCSRFEDSLLKSRCILGANSKPTISAHNQFGKEALEAEMSRPEDTILHANR